MKSEILKRVSDVVRSEFGEECEIEFPEITKNNGSVKQAMVIRRIGDAVCPVIYIDGLLNEIESGCRSIHDAAVEIVETYWSANVDTLRLSGITKKLNKQVILENVVYKLVNTERNIGMLYDMPHKALFDLSAIYIVIAGEDEDRIGSIAVSHELRNAYAIGEDELDLAARKNTKEEGFCVMSMGEIMAEINGIPADEVEDEYLPMFILTSKSRKNGAAVMLYEEYFGGLARKLKSDLYVMPSSIHEVIAVPTDGFDLDALRKTVIEVNAGEVSDEEILGENVYKYDLEVGKMEILC